MATHRVTEYLASARPWRTGESGRTIYVQVGPDSSDEDVLIGVMDTPRLAAEVVRAHNTGAS